MQQEDEEAGDVVVRVRVESQVHETVHTAVQPNRRSPPSSQEFTVPFAISHNLPVSPRSHQLLSRFDCGVEENSGGASNNHCRIRGIKLLIHHQKFEISVSAATEIGGFAALRKGE